MVIRVVPAPHQKQIKLPLLYAAQVRVRLPTSVAQRSATVVACPMWRAGLLPPTREIQEEAEHVHTNSYCCRTPHGAAALHEE